MLVAGIILLIGGLVSLIMGFVMNNSLEAQLGNILSGGGGNPGTIWIIIGVVALVAGIVLLILNNSKKKA